MKGRWGGGDLVRTYIARSVYREDTGNMYGSAAACKVVYWIVRCVDG